MRQEGNEMATQTASGFDLQAISQQLAEHTETSVAPLESWNPEFCGDIDMRIARNGQWFYMGTPIGRQRMVNLFARVLWKEDDRYFLKTPVEKIGIQVDDVPFLITGFEQVEGEKGAELWFTSSTEDEICAGAKHPIRVVVDDETGEPSPYIAMRFGMEALISRAVFYQLVELAELEQRDDGEHLVVESAGQRFSLGCC